jgi:hypothetical protein
MAKRRNDKPVFWSCPRLWPGETVVILAGGPSLSAEQVEMVRHAHISGHIRVIVINSSYLLAPWADVLYACDTRWWDANPAAYGFAGLKVTLGPEIAAAHPDVRLLERTFAPGLDRAPTRIRTGKNGGYQALGLAFHLAGEHLDLLLGYDLRCAVGPDGRRVTHWHGGHKHRQWQVDETTTFLPEYPALAADLAAAGVAVVNCTPGSALKCFEFGDLAVELARDRLARGASVSGAAANRPVSPSVSGAAANRPDSP